MPTFIRNYVEGCAICQQHKINHHPLNPALQPVKSEHACPFSLIIMDFITNLPMSEGFNSIMVMVDHGSTKGVILEPCNKTIDTTRTRTILLNTVYQRYGLPDKSISDRGPQFMSQAFRELGQLLGIKLKMSMAHHPQTDGATEQANQEIEAYLSIFCCNNPETWHSLIPNHMLHRKNPHSISKWDMIRRLYPQHTQKQTSLKHKTDYSYSKKHRKKLKLLMN